MLEDSPAANKAFCPDVAATIDDATCGEVAKVLYDAVVLDKGFGIDNTGFVDLCIGVDKRVVHDDAPLTKLHASSHIGKRGDDGRQAEV